jgi:hypothetical protein
LSFLFPFARLCVSMTLISRQRVHPPSGPTRQLTTQIQIGQF